MSVRSARVDASALASPPLVCGASSFLGMLATPFREMLAGDYRDSPFSGDTVVRIRRKTYPLGICEVRPGCFAHWKTIALNLALVQEDSVGGNKAGLQHEAD